MHGLWTRLFHRDPQRFRQPIPISFTNETVTRQGCANGATCTITIPSLPNRVLYYVIDRLDSSGNVVATTPLAAVTVP